MHQYEHQNQTLLSLHYKNERELKTNEIEYQISVASKTEKQYLSSKTDYSPENMADNCPHFITKTDQSSVAKDPYCLHNKERNSNPTIDLSLVVNSDQFFASSDAPIKISVKIDRANKLKTKMNNRKLRFHNYTTKALTKIRDAENKGKPH